MSDLWFVYSASPWGDSGYQSPDPLSNPGWTWDVEFVTSSNQWTYARGLVGGFNYGGSSAAVWSYVLSYRTRDANGVDIPHEFPLTGFVNDTAVVDVTFAWALSADDWCDATVIMEIWVSG